ncbi:cytochrome c oxidase subunit II [Pararhizobium mangrovi]|uniref:Cytochrome c oxidase subunit 2 n=2 Tax=Pararhizobium mangrovi TaxID=2590452 RepID=A0A506U4J7_9HYPH|nr:cytochrome c oxidase subunit II [Pararhizobium mangrovi]TPW28740.1 cytochrome c oxidase subunit II [Pararhizobium mangrovi]
MRFVVLAGATVPACATGAFAAKPTDWETQFQPAATDIMAQIQWFANYTMWFVVPIVVLVMALLGIVMFRFRASANPTPSGTSHNTLIEVAWTVLPVLVLLFIAIPSFQLLTAQYSPPAPPAVTVKATGHQWYWSYDYQGGGKQDVSFDSLMLDADGRKDADKTDMAQYPRLLAVDNEMVVPVGKVVRVLVTSGDVIHSFAMPSFGVKMDAIPGRINEAWFKVEKPGIYYGQCSELCGQNHAFMPIAVRAVTPEQYRNWAASAAKDLGSANKQLRASIAAGRKNDDVASGERAGTVRLADAAAHEPPYGSQGATQNTTPGTSTGRE